MARGSGVRRRSCGVGLVWARTGLRPVRTLATRPTARWWLGSGVLRCGGAAGGRRWLLQLVAARWPDLSMCGRGMAALLASGDGTATCCCWGRSSGAWWRWWLQHRGGRSGERAAAWLQVVEAARVASGQACLLCAVARVVRWRGVVVRASGVLARVVCRRFSELSHARLARVRR